MACAGSISSLHPRECAPRTSYALACRGVWPTASPLNWQRRMSTSLLVSAACASPLTSTTTKPTSNASWRPCGARCRSDRDAAADAGGGDACRGHSSLHSGLAVIAPSAATSDLPVARSIRAAEFALNTWFDLTNLRHENLTPLTYKGFDQGSEAACRAPLRGLVLRSPFFSRRACPTPTRRRHRDRRDRSSRSRRSPPCSVRRGPPSP